MIVPGASAGSAVSTRSMACVPPVEAPMASRPYAASARSGPAVARDTVDVDGCAGADGGSTRRTTRARAAVRTARTSSAATAGTENADPGFAITSTAPNASARTARSPCFGVTELSTTTGSG